MTRSKMNEARRRRHRQGRTPVVTPRERDVTTAPAPIIPGPWSRRSLVILGAMALVLQFVIAMASVQRGTFADALVVLLDGQTLVLVVSFPIVAPLARRLLKETRPLRLVESMTSAAVALLLFLGVELVAALAGSLLKRPPALDRGHPVVLIGFTIGLAVACLAGPPLAPFLQKFFVPRGTRPTGPS